MAKSDMIRKTGLQRIPGGVGRVAVRCAAGISTFTLGVTVAAMAAAGGKFKAPPVTAEAQAAAEAEPTMILGYEANTMFFVAAGVIALFWFTLGGGRKPKLNRE